MEYFDYTITREIPVRVRYSLTAASRGSIGDYGQRMEPDEEAGIEIESITVGGEYVGKPIELTAEEVAEIQAAIEESEGL